MRIARSLASWTVGLACLAGLGAGSLPAQEPSLERVSSLSDDGRVSEARSALQSWWDAEWDQASADERQRALWLRGTLAVDPSVARRDYVRLVLEHPGGRHSAEALLRLAQSHAVAGRPVAAARRYEQLLREYPDSPHRLEARRWLDEHREEVGRARAEAERDAARTGGARDSASAAGGPGGAAAAGSARDTAAPGAPAEEQAADTERGAVSVQLGAFGSEERARRLLQRAREEGVTGLRLVRVEGSDLIRIRTGRFSSRRAASSLRSRIEEQGFATAVVTDADRESPVQ